MKIKLLNNGGYGDMEDVKFPVEVEGANWEDSGFDVSGSEIIRVGGDARYWNANVHYFWLNEEVEVLT